MDWAVLWLYRAALWDGLAITIGVSVLGMIGSTVLGVAIGCVGTLPSYLLRRLTDCYTETLRNLPLIVKLFFLYFIAGLPPFVSAVLALVLHQSAYIADVTRAGIRSVAGGQMDAALSLGHGYAQAFRYIVLPQMVRFILPTMTSQYVSVVRSSAVVALIAVPDLTFETQQINVETFRGFEAATAATVLYMLVCSVVIGAMTLLQRHGAWR